MLTWGFCEALFIGFLQGNISQNNNNHIGVLPVVLIFLIVGFFVWAFLSILFRILYFKRLGMIDEKRMKLSQSFVLFFIFVVISSLQKFHIGSIFFQLLYGFADIAIFLTLTFRFIKDTVWLYTLMGSRKR
jgi:hypothetical protein